MQEDNPYGLSKHKDDRKVFQGLGQQQREVIRWHAEMMAKSQFDDGRRQAIDIEVEEEAKI